MKDTANKKLKKKSELKEQWGFERFIGGVFYVMPINLSLY